MGEARELLDEVLHGMGTVVIRKLGDFEGVYILLDEKGDPLYVGQSQAVYARVNSHRLIKWYRAIAFPVAGGIVARCQVETALMYLLKTVHNWSDVRQKVIASANLDAVVEDPQRLIQIIRGDTNPLDAEHFLTSEEKERRARAREKEHGRLIRFRKYREQQAKIQGRLLRAPLDGPSLLDKDDIPQVMVGELRYQEEGWKELFNDPRTETRKRMYPECVDVKRAYFYLWPNKYEKIEGGWQELAEGDIFYSSNSVEQRSRKVEVVGIMINPVLKGFVRVRYTATGYARTFPCSSFEDGGIQQEPFYRLRPEDEGD
jgi:hypothetical protein